ncbi:hypothetical protein AB0H51_11490 [Streptomyces griseoluteus]|uniref:hypothetical protein n=1 Tax=Streptomyces griseoluteus TaxID=29306 RepID=UPI0033D537EF
MDLFLVRTDPIQEIAAEPGTLDLLRNMMSQEWGQPPASPDFLACGWPLVHDESLPPGFIHCRPSGPNASEPPTVAEVETYLRTLMRPAQP